MLSLFTALCFLIGIVLLFGGAVALKSMSDDITDIPPDDWQQSAAGFLMLIGGALVGASLAPVLRHVLDAAMNAF